MNSKKLISLFSTLLLGTSIFPFQLVNADESNQDVQIDKNFQELSNANDSVIDRFNKFSVFKESLNTKKDVNNNTDVMKKDSISSSEELISPSEKTEESNEQITSSSEKTEESNEQITSSSEKTEESNEQITSSSEENAKSNTPAESDYIELDYNYLKSNFEFIEEPGFGVFRLVGTKKKDITKIIIPTTVYHPKYYTNWEVQYDQGFINSIKKDSSYKNYLKEFKIAIRNSTPLNPWNKSEMDLSDLFCGFGSLTKVDLEGLNWGKIKSTARMFENCYSIKEIDLSNWRGLDSNRSVDMTRMFSNTASLRKIDLRNMPLDYQKTTEILGTRSSNTSANNVPLTVIVDPYVSSKFLDFDFENESGRIPASFPVLDANGGRFPKGNSTLKYLDKICVTPEQLQLSTFNNWKEDKIPNKEGATFKQWVPSKEVGSPSSVFDLLGVVYQAQYESFDWTFEENDKDVLLTSYIGTNTDIVVPNEIHGKPTKIDLTKAFYLANFEGPYNWTKVTSVKFSNKNGKKVKAIGNGLWFKDWSNMKSFDGSGLDVSSLRDMNHAFSGCQSLNDINLSGWNTSNVENMSYMFYGCSSLSSIDVSHFSTNNVTTMNRMFNGCTNLKSIDVSHFNTKNVTDFWAMFYECSSLVSLDVSNFNTSKATIIRSMFYGANKLKNIDVSNFDIRNVTDMSYMFEGCTSLGELNLSTWTLKSDSKSVDMTLMFDNTPALRKIDLRDMSLDTQNTYKILGDKSTGTSATNQPLTVIVNPTTSSKFLNYDFVSESGRVPASFPVLDANGGSFSSGNSTIKYINKICVTPEQLQLSTFNNWKEDNIPNKDGFTFKQWVPSREVDSPQSVFDLLDVKYVAEWEKIIDNNIPSPDDNVKPDVISEFGIAYYPKEFSIKNTPLNDSGSQSISFEKKGTFNVGIRDVSNLKDKWTLDAQLVWTGNKKIEGGEILTTNSEGLVNKNINNGEDPFNPVKDLIPCDSTEIGSKSNVVINSNAPERLMTAKAVNHNGVYDYNLGDKVSLRIPETKNIEAGSYSGYVQWTLSNAIS
ncbi:BspA family leucine-rich repeat surface protein [Enterococcus hirae]